jgi:hypothetical protein
MTQIKTMKKVMTTTKLAGQKKNNRHHGMPVNTGVESGFVIMRQDGERRTTKSQKKVDQRPKGKKQANPEEKVLESFSFL